MFSSPCIKWPKILSLISKFVYATLDTSNGEGLDGVHSLLDNKYTERLL